MPFWIPTNDTINQEAEQKMFGFSKKYWYIVFDQGDGVAVGTAHAMVNETELL